MAKTFRVEGLREVEAALSELPKATGKNVLRRVLKQRAQPVANAMRAKAPVDEGDLRNSIAVGTKLSRRQRQLHKKMFKSDKASVEMFVGAGPLPQAIAQEFGTVSNEPQPFARPAWDENKYDVLDGLKDDLWSEIDKAAARLAKKSAKAGA